MKSRCHPLGYEPEEIASARWRMTSGIKTAIHVGLAFCAYLFAYQLVLWPHPEWWGGAGGLSVLGFAGLYAGIAAAFELLFRTERSSWRYVSVPDAFVLVRSTFLTAATFLLATFILVRADGIPRSVLLIAWLGHLGGLAALRMVRRLSHENSLLRTVVPMLDRAVVPSNRLLLVGNIGAADSFLRELSRDSSPKHHPVGILGLHPSDTGQLVRGVAVRGSVSDLEDAVAAFHIRDQSLTSILFLSPPDVVQNIAPEVLGRLKTSGIVLLRLPAMSELGATRGSLPTALRVLSVEELLARPTINLDLARIHDLVNGKRVLVTGAGGSIGSELCRQVTAFGCSHLSLLDHSEFALFKIDQEIEVDHPELSRREIICDVRDRARVTAWVAAEAPDIIFHAAALKHVPIVEKHPAEGVLTNVVGTWNIAEAARAAGVRQMVMISTDKAVDPSNIMGATKRLAEAIIRGQHGQSRTLFSVVRFGNVLGSAGSVVPTFQAQIERGGPVTVTHPDVERYFMTIPEAVQLVLYATAQSAARDLSQPSVFVLEMGEPVKIADLARNMITLHGLTPDVDVEVRFTGLRPGEKLTEDLIDTSERVLARIDSVIEVVDHDPSTVLSAPHVRALEGVARNGDEAGVRQAVFEHLARLRSVDVPKAVG